MFHLRDGVYFGRTPSGKICVRVTRVMTRVFVDQDNGHRLKSVREEFVEKELEVTESEFASVMASCSRRGEDGATFQQALNFLEQESVA